MARRYSRIMQADNLLQEAQQYKQQLRVKSRQKALHGKSIRFSAIDTLLKKSGNKWGFGSEEALENFIWENLENLLSLTPLKRQHQVNGEVCDILALDPSSKQLVVQELKNDEYRGLVPQLTRYYTKLIEFKPFDPNIDYSQPIRLLAIAPSFHKQNLIDREYSKLSFDFLKFDVVQDGDNFIFNLTNIDTGKVFSAEIKHSQEDIWDLAANLPEVPKALHNIMAECSPEKKAQILKFRERILCFHEKIQEITASGVVKYGRGKSKICAEICHSNSSKISQGGLSHYPALFLYLPIPDKKAVNCKQPLGKMQFLADELQNILSIYYIPQAKTGVSRLYCFQDFQKFISQENVTNQLTQVEMLIDLALRNWLERF